MLQKIKEKLISLYLWPVQNSYKWGLSVRNRIFLHQLHLVGLETLLKNIPKENRKGFILDIGCFDGGTSVFLASHFPELSVIAFEPNKEVLDRGKASHAVPGNLRFENIALSDSDGLADFFKTDNEVSSSLNQVNDNQKFSTVKKEQVVVKTLDNYMQSIQAKEPVLAMKIDVQGHEKSVLKGARASLQNTLYVLLEMANHSDYENGAKYFEMDQFLREAGFTLSNIFTPFRDGSIYEYDAIYMNTSFRFISKQES